MRVSRRTLIASLAAAPAAALSSKTVFAADYPDRPIHLIVPFAPGGNADIVGRITGQLMGDGLNGTVVVENHDGAGGSVGAATGRVFVWIQCAQHGDCRSAGRRAIATEGATGNLVLAGGNAGVPVVPV